MKKSSLLKIIQRFPNQKILVIGDVMLDWWIEGTAERLSPEAPVPIVKKTGDQYFLGGAGNVAANISTLEGKVKLIGAIGRDSNGEKISRLAKEKNIEFIIGGYQKITTAKIRVSAGGHQITRIDEEKINPIYIDSKILISEAEKAQVIILSDYAKGIVTQKLMNDLEKYKRKMLVDPKPQNKNLYKRVYLITPNKLEAEEMANKKDFFDAGELLRKKLGANILITRGEKGMSLFNGGEIYLPTYAKEVYDVTGAGDTVIGTIALALSAKASLKDAAIIANHAAGIVVGKKGTAQTNIEELSKKIKEYKE